MVDLNKNKSIILAVLLLLFIFFPLPLPFELATLIDTKLGSLLVVTFAIIVFLTVHPIIGLLTFVAGYVLLYRAGISTGSDILHKYIPNEDDKHQEMLNLHSLNNGKSLEEEAVDNIPPQDPDAKLLSEDPYQPIYSNSSIEHTML